MLAYGIWTVTVLDRDTPGLAASERDRARGATASERAGRGVTA